MKSAQELIKEERRRQNEKWGEQNHPDILWHVILSEEVGEAAQEILEIISTDKSEEDLIKEIVQIAAVAKAWLECKIRNQKNEGGITCKI